MDRFGSKIVLPVSAKIEFELSQLSPAEKSEFMDSMGLKKSGLEKIIRASYDRLGLITFFTAGPKESHAWALEYGETVVKAAGKIHSDLEKGFICAEVYNFSEIKKVGSEQELKKSGLVRTEGRDYIVQDGDVVLIRFNL